MKKKGLMILLGLVVMLLAGCTTFKMSGVQMFMDKGNADILGKFEKTVMVNKFIGSSGGSNLFNISSDATDPVIYQTIRQEVDKMGGDAAINVSIEYKASFLDMLANGITGYIWAPSHVVITGTVIGRATAPNAANAGAASIIINNN